MHHCETKNNLNNPAAGISGGVCVNCLWPVVAGGGVMTVRIITDSNGRKHITNEPLLHQPALVQSCFCPNCEAMGKELAALKAQPAPVQEPVAWMYELIIDGEVCNVECTNVNWNPEYQPFGRAGIDFVEGGKVTKTPIYTTPPAQRPWIGLTDEEIEQGCKESWVTEQAFQSAVWWAEAKLKEKNT
jgi:hypothetical protein